jgi:hypothetical protein
VHKGIPHTETQTINKRQRRATVNEYDSFPSQEQGTHNVHKGIPYTDTSTNNKRQITVTVNGCEARSYVGVRVDD